MPRAQLRSKRVFPRAPAWLLGGALALASCGGDPPPVEAAIDLAEASDLATVPDDLTRLADVAMGDRGAADGAAQVDLAATGDLAPIADAATRDDGAPLRDDAAPADFAAIDLAPAAALDLGPAADLAVPADSSQSLDLTRPPDVAPPVDLAPADFAAPRDLAPTADLATPPDLARPPDLTAPRDLASVPDLAVPAPPPRTVLVPAGAVWRYLDDGSNQGTAWQKPGFDDSKWKSGPAELGYGDGDEATVVSFGPDAANKRTTTWFRRTFTVNDLAAVKRLDLKVRRDDGIAVYLNGVEVMRDNLANNAAFQTLATATISDLDESAWIFRAVDPARLVAGTNTLAVEIHQVAVDSSDISFDLELVGSTRIAALRRGPYLQRGTSTSVVVRWRTDVATDSRVRVGAAPGQLGRVIDLGAKTTEHEVLVAGLTPATRYYYGLGSTSEMIAGDDAATWFRTPPTIGAAQPVRLWVLGDSGTGTQAQRDARDGFTKWNANRPIDFWLMLGDNAYQAGTDAEYQVGIFDAYPTWLTNFVLWPTFGNHDAGSADSASQTGPYYDLFTLPKQAEAGGVASGTEAYYSFDHAQVHFVCLDSQGSNRLPGSPMLNWLDADLTATNQPWIIAFFHHPPYTKGTHDSDTDAQLTEVRQYFLPILERQGVDLVLAGHSHVYERSYLLDGHYGTSGTLMAKMILDQGDGRVGSGGAYTKTLLKPRGHQGAVYTVAGTSGQIGGGPLNHPAMFISLNQLGSMVIDVQGATLDAKFLNDKGLVADSFTIRK